MTHSQIGTPYPTAETGSTPVTATTQSTGGSPSTTDVAKDEARNVGQTAAAAGGEVASHAKHAGTQVASTAADQAKNVAGEAKQQVSGLVDQGRQQLQDQARNGQQKAAQGLTALAAELRSMADNGQQSGPATQLVRQATDKVDEVATWVSSREPGDLVDEVRAFARRRPGAFLVGAALAGVLAGRLTTGVVKAHKDEQPQGLTGRTDTRSSDAVYGNSQYTTQANYVDETYTPAPAYTPAPSYTDGTYAGGYDTTQVPPPPYGSPTGTSVPPATPSGWDDPQRGLGEGGRR